MEQCPEYYGRRDRNCQIIRNQAFWNLDHTRRKSPHVGQAFLALRLNHAKVPVASRPAQFSCAKAGVSYDARSRALYDVAEVSLWYAVLVCATTCLERLQDFA